MLHNYYPSLPCHIDMHLKPYLLTLVGNDLRDQFARYTEQRKHTALVSFTKQSLTVLPENCIHMAKQAVAPRHGLAWHFARMTVCSSINTIVSWDNGNYSSICYLLCNYFLMSTQEVLNIIEWIRTQYCDWTLHTMCDSLNFQGMMRVDGMGWHKKAMHLQLSPVSGPH